MLMYERQLAKVGGIAEFDVTAFDFMSGYVRTTGDEVKVMLIA